MKKPANGIETQTNMILNYLLEGGRLTSLDALKLFNCFRLGARIYDIERTRGYVVSRKYVTTSSKKSVMQYWIEQQ